MMNNDTTLPFPLFNASGEIINRICDLSVWGLIKISGSDAKKFLQGQLTCNLDEMIPLHPSLGAHCNSHGRVLSLFYLFIHQDAYFLFMPHQLISIAISALKKYSIFFKTTIVDVSEEWRMLGYLGEDKYIQLANDAMRIILPLKKNLGIQRYFILDKKEFLKPTLNDFPHCSLLPFLMWKQLNLYDSLPMIYPETSGKFLPHDLSLEKLGAIAFNKGCYTGQEIIARMHYRANLKKRLYYASIMSSNHLSPGDEIYCREDEKIKVAGTLVDVCPSMPDDHHYNVLLVTETTNAKNHFLFLDQNEKEFFNFTELLKF